MPTRGSRAPGRDRKTRQQRDSILHRHNRRPFQLRYNNYNNTFRKAKHKNSISLSKHIWDLKDNNIKFSIKWKIIKRCKAYKNSSKKCNLRLHEKFLITCHPELSTLNTRNAGRHRKKHLYLPAFNALMQLALTRDVTCNIYTKFP